MKKESTVPISRVLFRRQAAASAIYPIRESPHGFSIPPSAGVSRAGNPQTAVYMNLQPPADTARRSPGGWWSLTHAFSPLPALRLAVVFFCRSLLSPIASIFRSGAPCAARTFLPRHKWTPTADRDTAFVAQNYHFFPYLANVAWPNLHVAVEKTFVCDACVGCLRLFRRPVM